MAQDSTFDHTEVEKRHDTDRTREQVGVPLVRRPAVATRAADVADVNDVDNTSNRPHVNGQELR
jgi:hypothetical protein